MRTGTLRSAMAAVGVLVGASILPASGGPALQGAKAIPPKISLKLACSETTSLEVEDWRGAVFGNNLYFLVSLLSRHGIEIEIARVPRLRGIVDTVNGKYDGLCSCLSNENLQKTFHYSQPLGYISIGVVTKRGAYRRSLVKHPRLKNRSPVRLGVVAGDGLEAIAKSKGLKGFTVLESHQQGYQMLDLGRIDRMIVLGSSVRRDARRLVFSLKYQYTELDRPTVHLCLSGAKGKEIISTLDGALQSYRLLAGR